jgi:regulatory protein
VSSPSALFPPDDSSDFEPTTARELDTGSSDVIVTVVALRESPRAPGRYAITLSDGRSFIVGVAALAGAGATRVGASLDADAVAQLAREATVSDLVARAIGMLARGRRTRRELEIRLRKREQDPALITLALDRMHAQGLIADQDVARAEASARLRRGEAPARVRMTLQSKGIAGREAEHAVQDAMRDDAFDERESCRALAAKKWRTLANVDSDVARRRLIGFLQRRGFGGGVVRDVLDDLRRTSQDP